jgi:oligopeptide/dipeptide ABC transporter ATP-binding protein
LAPSSLLEVRNLSIAYHLSSEIIRAVRNVSLQISEAETLVLAGETGSGKSTLAFALLGLLPHQTQVESGEILFEGRSLQLRHYRDWRDILNRKIGIIFQDARSTLNPVLSIEDHLIETLRAHQQLSKKNAHAKALELFREVGISKGQEKKYPFELSGGACQRVGIALALCNNPPLLIADEPTSALDPTLQAQILDLLLTLKQQHNLSLLMISHDLLMISRITDRISVMYHGRMIESGLRAEILDSPAHPYTQGLIQSQPRMQHHHERNPLTVIPGTMPQSGEDFPGCAFAPRCCYMEPPCIELLPAECLLSKTHWVACIHPRASSEKQNEAPY